MNPVEFMRNWCVNKESFSFFLPDGTEGKPFDNQYQMVSFSEEIEGFSIRLSDNINFIFKGNVIFRDEAFNLIITGFSRLIYQVNNAVVREFTDGEFCLSGF